MDTIPERLLLPPRTILRAGASRDALSVCGEFGRRGMLVCGRSLARSGELARIMEPCAGHDVAVWRHAGGEPSLDHVEALLSAARGHAAEWILAVGGGSVLDLAKAAAGLLEAPLPVSAYHGGEPIETSKIPFIAVPTTAGTGSEATSVSVLTDAGPSLKKSIRHDSFLPRLVILDPDLLVSCPRDVVAASGMDAFTQAVESFLSRGASWFSDMCALRAVGLINESLEAVFHDDGDTGQDRQDLLLGSYLAGVALANARLGLVHGLAHPLGARWHVPHGLACAVCLPEVLAFNRSACVERFEQLTSVLGSDVEQRARQLNQLLGNQSPFSGKSIEDRPDIIAETLASGSTAANPREVTAADVEGILDVLFAAGDGQGVAL